MKAKKGLALLLAAVFVLTSVLNIPGLGIKANAAETLYIYDTQGAGLKTSVTGWTETKDGSLSVLKNGAWSPSGARVNFDSQDFSAMKATGVLHFTMKSVTTGTGTAMVNLYNSYNILESSASIAVTKDNTYHDYSVDLSSFTNDLKNITGIGITAAGTGNMFSNIYISYQGGITPVITINTQPQSATVTQGTPVTLSVAASVEPSADLTYQWFKNGSSISGATAATYTVDTSVAGATDYFVKVSSAGAETVTSSTATVTVNAPADKVIALTFDDGVDGTSTSDSVPYKVYNYLKSQGCKATFFLRGNKLEDPNYGAFRRGVVQNMVADGFEIGYHGYQLHDAAANTATQQEVEEDVKGFKTLLNSLGASEIKYARPPYVWMSENITRAYLDQNMTGILGNIWNKEGLDPIYSGGPNAEQVLAWLQNNGTGADKGTITYDGSIILLHACYGHNNTLEALQTYIPWAKAQGYEFVTLTELFQRKGFSSSDLLKGNESAKWHPAYTSASYPAYDGFGPMYRDAVGSKTYPTATGSNFTPVAVNNIVVDTQPESANVSVGASLSLSAAGHVNGAVGTAVAYQWYENTTNSYDGATQNYENNRAQDYTVDTSTPGTKYYYCVINSAVTPPVKTNIVAVTVNDGPATITITKQPQSVSTNVGGTANLSVTASVDPSSTELSYQWYKNGAAISSATSATYAADTSAAGTDSYYVVVSGGGASVTSSTATVTVTAPTPSTGGVIWSDGYGPDIKNPTLLKFSKTDSYPIVGEGLITTASSPYLSSIGFDAVDYSAFNTGKLKFDYIKADMTAGPCKVQITSGGQTYEANVNIAGIASAKQSIEIDLSEIAGVDLSSLTKIGFQFQSWSSQNRFVMNNLRFEGGTPVPTKKITIDEDVEHLYSTRPETDVPLEISASVTEEGTPSYQWYACTSLEKTGATAIPGATDSSYTVNKSASGTYYYFCRVSADGAESEDSTVAEVFVDPIKVRKTFFIHQHDDGWNYNVTSGSDKPTNNYEEVGEPGSLAIRNSGINPLTPGSTSYYSNFQFFVSVGDMVTNSAENVVIRFNSNQPEGTSLETSYIIGEYLNDQNRTATSVVVGEDQHVAVNLSGSSVALNSIYGLGIVSFDKKGKIEYSDICIDYTLPQDFQITVDPEKPKDVTTPIKKAVSLQVTAETTGVAPLQYQWYRCSDVNRTLPVPIAGETNAKLTVTPTEVGETYYFCAVYSEDAEAVVTRVATVNAIKGASGQIIFDDAWSSVVDTDTSNEYFNIVGDKTGKGQHLETIDEVSRIALLDTVDNLINADAKDIYFSFSTTLAPGTDIAYSCEAEPTGYKTATVNDRGIVIIPLKGKGAEGSTLDLSTVSNLWLNYEESFELDNVNLKAVDTPEIIINEITGTETLAYGETPSAIAIDAEASDESALYYTWYKYTTDKADAERLSIHSASFVPEGLEVGKVNYYCVVSSQVYELADPQESEVVYKSVRGNLVFDKNIQDKSVVVGDTVKFTAHAVVEGQETEPVTYQWYTCDDATGTNPVAIPDATDTTCEIEVTSTAPIYVYCQASTTAEGVAPARSIIAKIQGEQVVVESIVYVNRPLFAEYTSDGVVQGVDGPRQQITVIASATDGSDLSYQWYECDENGENAVLCEEDSATSQDFLAPTRKAGNKWYKCLVTSATAGSAWTNVKQVTVVDRDDMAWLFSDHWASGVYNNKGKFDSPQAPGEWSTGFEENADCTITTGNFLNGNAKHSPITILGNLSGLAGNGATNYKLVYDVSGSNGTTDATQSNSGIRINDEYSYGWPDAGMAKAVTLSDTNCFANNTKHTYSLEDLRSKDGVKTYTSKNISVIGFFTGSWGANRNSNITMENVHITFTPEVIDRKIVIDQEPLSKLLEKGDKTNLSVVAHVEDKTTGETVPVEITYKWMKSEKKDSGWDVAVSGATYPNVSANETYSNGFKNTYYKCILSAEGAKSVETEIATIAPKTHIIETTSRLGNDKEATVAVVHVEDADGIIRGEFLKGDTDYAVVVDDSAPEFIFDYWERVAYDADGKVLSKKNVSTDKHYIETSGILPEEARVVYTAVFTSDGFLKLEVKTPNEGDSYLLTKGGKTITDNPSYYDVGRIQLTLSYTGTNEFMYWVNETGVIVSTSPIVTFNLVTNSVFVPVTQSSGPETQGAVTFIANAQVVKVANVSSLAEVESQTPVVPGRLGTDPAQNHWDKTAAEIWSEIQGGTKNVTVTAQYVKSSEKVTITIRSRLADSKNPLDPEKWSEMTYQDEKTIEATKGNSVKLSGRDAIIYEGQDYNLLYVAMEDKNGVIMEGDKAKVLSHTLPITVGTDEDMIYYAVYGSATVEVQPTINVFNLNPIYGTTGMIMALTATYEVPAGFTVLNQGFIYGSNPNLDTTKDPITDSNCKSELLLHSKLAEERHLDNSVQANSFACQLTLKNVGAARRTGYLRAYLTYRDKNGETKTIYTDIYKGTYNGDRTGTMEPFTGGAKKYIAIMFEGGPENNIATTSVLDTLADYNTKATFFLSGVQIASNGQLTKRIANAGNQIASNAYQFNNKSKEVIEALSKDEIVADMEDFNAQLLKTTGRTTNLICAPKIAESEAICEAALEEDGTFVLGNFNEKEYNNTATATEILNWAKSSAATYDGSIVRFTLGRTQTAAVLQKYIPYLQSNGYEIVTIDELFAAKGVTPITGNGYFNKAELASYGQMYKDAVGGTY